jgi:hypothetical protein
MAYRHGFRAAELVDLRWDQIDFHCVLLHARRAKNGMPSTHPIQGDELRALRCLQRESKVSACVSVSERGSPFTAGGFARMLERAAAAGRLGIKAHPRAGMATAMRSPTRAMTPARFEDGSAIRPSRRQQSIPRWRRVDSSTSGARVDKSRRLFLLANPMLVLPSRKRVFRIDFPDMSCQRGMPIPRNLEAACKACGGHYNATHLPFW